MARRTGACPRETGFALLIALAALLVGGLLFLATTLSNRLNARSSTDTALLTSALEAVRSYGLLVNGAAGRPGDLTSPDITNDGNYDGNADAGCFDVTKANGLPPITRNVNSRCLGRLPWRTLQLTMNATAENDPAGIVPWFAVSANLADLGCLSVLNSETLSAPIATAFACDVASPLPYPWLTIRDGQGNVLSNRVAFVLILPGPPVAGQTRPTAPNLAGANQYLDSVTVNAVSTGCPTPPCTFSNADLDNDFIVGDQSATFNDRLTYVTIDEWMRLVEQRVGKEVVAGIERYRSLTGAYPWLGAFNPVPNRSVDAIVGTRSGAVPFHSLGDTASFDRAYMSDFQWTISGGSFTFTGTGVTVPVMRNTGSLVVPNANCVWNSMGVTGVECSGVILNPGAGVTERKVRIQYPGSTASPTVTYQTATAALFGRRQVQGSFSTCASGCIWVEDWNGASQVGTGVNVGTSGTITISQLRYYPQLPAWYADNQWYRLIHGTIAAGAVPPANGLNCGGSCLAINQNGAVLKNDVRLAVLSAGNALAGTEFRVAPPQARPSAALAEYFDSANNNNPMGSVFDIRTTLTPQFNDQVFWQ